jgi:hypothetical protein
MKLLPNTVTVLPAYTEEGNAELIFGRSLISIVLDSGNASSRFGFVKRTLTAQTPISLTFSRTAVIIVDE